MSVLTKFSYLLMTIDQWSNEGKHCDESVNLYNKFAAVEAFEANNPH